MSSNEEEERAPMKKKGHRPCDMCRRKKRRCDGGEPCSRCVKHEYNCTYQQKAMPRLASSRSYVHSLEIRLKTVEGLLRDSNIVSSVETSLDCPTPDLEGLEIITRAIRGLNKPFPAPSSEDLTYLDVAQSLSSLSLSNPSNHGFQGKSSQAMLVKTAVDLRSQAVPAAASPPVITRPAKPWTIKPWEDLPSVPDYTFPPDDLMLRLIALYFSNVNIFFPALHRPTFETSFASHKHLADSGYARTLLLVCALGARYSHDPRVLVPGRPFETAGCLWFDQVKLTIDGQPTLYDLQCYCLAVQFLDRTSGSRAAWTIAGIGIRLGQDIGAHRLKSRRQLILPEEELEKRAYWTLVVYDAQLSAALGRSIAIQAHDFDLDLPYPVDDEYWESSSRNAAFCQPAEKPSLVEFLNCQLNLNRILSFTLKVFYSTNRSRSIIGVSDDSWEQLVMEFDSALNTWRDSVPAHLCWNRGREKEDSFFDQSAALWCNYYLSQILIHRPFIHKTPSSSALKGFPSLTICNTAARACSHVAAQHNQRRPNNPLVFGHTAIFTAGIVLLLNIWGGHRGGNVQDADFSDVHRCMGVLRAYNERWPAAGPLLDTLEQLLKVDHAPQPSYESPSFGGSDSSGGTGGNTSSPPSAPREGNLGVPTPGSVISWPAYDPALATFADSEMLNHDYGPGEAPARAPQVEAAYSGFRLGGTSFPDAVYGTPLPSYTLGSLQQYGDANTIAMDSDTVAIWSAAPSGFEVSDWDSYLGSIGS